MTHALSDMATPPLASAITTPGAVWTPLMPSTPPAQAVTDLGLTAPPDPEIKPGELSRYSVFLASS